MEQSSSSSSSLNYDPLDNLPIIDHQNLRLYDYFGATYNNSNLSLSMGGGGGCGGGGGGGTIGLGLGPSPGSLEELSSNELSSPLYINQCPIVDQLDSLSHDFNFPFRTELGQEDPEDSDLQGTLASCFVDDLGVDSDGCYNPGVDLYSTNINNNNFNSNNNNNNHQTLNHHHHHHHNLHHYTNHCAIDVDSNVVVGQDVVSGKRSVLMNLLIDGSDASAGYTSHNFRALPQKIIQQQQQQQQLLQQQQQQPLHHHQQNNI